MSGMAEVHTCPHCGEGYLLTHKCNASGPVDAQARRDIAALLARVEGLVRRVADDSQIVVELTRRVIALEAANALPALLDAYEAAMVVVRAVAASDVRNEHCECALCGKEAVLNEGHAPGCAWVAARELVK